MEYRSTRGSGCRQTSAGAILYGLAPDGGLFVPETIPQFTTGELAERGLRRRFCRAGCRITAGTSFCPIARQLMRPNASAGQSPRRCTLWETAFMCLSCGTARRARLRISRCSCCRGFYRQRRENAEQTKRSPFWWRLRVIRARRRWQGLLGCRAPVSGFSTRTAVSATCSACKW